MDRIVATARAQGYAKGFEDGKDSTFPALVVWFVTGSAAGTVLGLAVAALLK